MAHELVLFRLGQGPAAGQRGQLGHDGFMVVVLALLLGTQGHKEIAVSAFGQLGFNIGLAAAEEIGFDAQAQFVKVAIGGGAAPVVQFIILAVEAEERAKERRVEEVHQGIQFVEAVFDGCAGEDEGVAAAEAFDGLGGFGAPIFYALGFVKHNDVGPQAGVDVQGVGEHLLVINDGKERSGGVSGEAAKAAAIDQLVRQRGETLDLFFPFAFERGGGDDEDMAGLAHAVEQGAGGNALNGFAQTHFVGQQGAFRKSEVEHAFTLVGKERHGGFVRGPLAALHLEFILAA